jgi:uncharacterized membrane protein YbhN (UPF0104 family)
MSLTLLEAQALCLGCFATDTLARGLRLKLLLRGLGRRISARGAMAVNLMGDAGCALTPYRFGGEPTRLAGLAHARIPLVAAMVAIGFEVATVWPLVGCTALLLGALHGREWWATAVPRLVESARSSWMLLLIVVLAMGVVGWLGRRWSHGYGRLRRSGRRARVYMRRMPVWVLILSLPLTAASVSARIAVLPVLLTTLQPQPRLGPSAVGSFALLYSQLVLPTPSGAGAVDLGFVGGAAGDLGPQQARLLLLWRFYSSGLGAVAGLALAARLFGVQALRRAVAGALLARRRAVTVTSSARHDSASA